MPLFDPFPTLTTARLHLRALTCEDTAEMFRLDTAPHVARYLGRPPSPSLEATRAKVEAIVADTGGDRTGFWALVDAVSGAFVGSACLWNWDRSEARADLGYLIDPSRWGQGLASEALVPIVDFGFRRMALDRVDAHVHPENLASIRVLTKLGFRPAPERRDDPDDDGVCPAVYSLARC